MMPYLMGCLSNDGAFWRLGADNGAERYTGAGRWIREANAPLAELSVGAMGAAWGVDTSGNLQQLTRTPVTQVSAPPVREVAVSPDDDLWIMNWGDNNNLYHRVSDGQWERVENPPAYPAKLGCGPRGDVWMLAESWFWGYPWERTATGWVQRGDMPAFNFGVGSDSLAYTNRTGEGPLDIYRETPSGPWTEIPSPVDYAIACIGGNEVWVAGGEAFQRNGAGWNEYPAPPGVNFDGIAAASDGTVVAWQGEWSKGGQAYRFNGTGGWEPLPIAPAQGFFGASVAHAHNHYFALWENHALMHWAGSAWTSAGRAVKKVAACADGTVWTIDASGTAARRAADGTWQAFTDQLTHIGAGGRDIAWGVDATGAPRKWDGTAFQSFSSDLAQGLTDISVGSDAAVCAVAADKSLLYLSGTSWKPLQPGQDFLRVQVSSADRICAVTAIDPLSRTNFIWNGAIPATPDTRSKSKAPPPKAPPKTKRRRFKEPKGKLRHWYAPSA